MFVCETPARGTILITGKTLARLRRLHLYMGVPVAPLILFFALSGAWQTFGFHKDAKDGSYIAPTVLSVVSDVHEHQRAGSNAHRSTAFAVVALLAALGIVATTAIGILMAFRFAPKPLIVWGLLAVGVLLPAFLLWIGS